MKKTVLHYVLIFCASVLYAVGTLLLIFPHSLLLGGTSGISVILHAWLPISPGLILGVINLSLIVLAFFVLGKSMGIRTTVGSVLTTAAVTLLEPMFARETPLIENPFLSAFCGAAIIAVASGVMFFVGSSSGGTDVIALIVQKYSKFNIGRALLLTDCLIVLVGGILSGWIIFFASTLGLLVKAFGIDGVITLIKHIKKNPIE
ncbi:MAG: YitT family protein [Clostridia bacterium]|nr:YitT family protein [Clostridia bacterium]